MVLGERYSVYCLGSESDFHTVNDLSDMTLQKCMLDGSKPFAYTMKRLHNITVK
jgi:hypothetical protein